MYNYYDLYIFRWSGGLIFWTFLSLGPNLKYSPNFSPSSLKQTGCAYNGYASESKRHANDLS